MAEITSISSLLKMLQNISDSHKQKLIEQFEQAFQVNSDNIRDKKYPAQLACPSCNSDKIAKFGFSDAAKTRRRLRCKSCNRHFNDHTGTLLHRKKLRKHVWLFLQMLLDGYSIRKTAAALKVSPTTINAWRQSVLSFIEKNINHILSELHSTEIIEESVRNFKPSRKGLSPKTLIPPTAQTIIFRCNRRNQYQAFVSPLDTQQSNNPVVLKQSPTYTAAPPPALPAPSCAANRLLLHSRHIQELQSQFSVAYRRMRGVASANLYKYALWHCLVAQLNRLRSKERLQTLFLLCI